MSGDGDESHPAMDEVEMLNAIRNVAKMSRVLYEELLEQGFDKADALLLAGRYIHGTAGGKVA